MKVVGLALLLGAMTIGVYAPLWSAGFVYEDAHHLATMTADLTPGGSLVGWTYRLNTVFGSGDPRGLHLTNLGVHLVNGALVGGLAWALGLGPWAWLAAAIFLLHPIQVEAVAYISGRPDLLMTTGALVALWTAVVGLRQTRPVLVVLSLGVVTGASLVALEAKASGVAVLGLLAWLVTIRGSLGRDRIGGLLAVGAAVLWGVLWRRPLSDWEALSITLRDLLLYPGQQSVAVWRYASLVLVPVGFSVDHDFLVPPLVGLVAMVAVIASGVGLWRLRVLQPTLALTLGWALLAVAPRLVVGPIYAPHVPEYLNEHQMYLAMVGISLAGAWIVAVIQQAAETIRWTPTWA